MIEPRAIVEAHDRIRPHVRLTPSIELERALFGPEAATFLKLETLQRTGSFKSRGTFNRLLLDGGTGPVVAASGGNHGLAVADAAHTLGRDATIFVPSVITTAKLALLRATGATILVGGATFADAHAACREFVAETGAFEVHAYDDPALVAGQGTVAREAELQAGGLDTLLVGVGGGGLIAGAMAWLGSRVSRGRRRVRGLPDAARCACGRCARRRLAQRHRDRLAWRPSHR